MGEEWAATSRFPFFCDFHGELADAVREGRRREFAQFKRFRDEKAREAIPDPNAVETFHAAKLDWSEMDGAPHKERLELFTRLLALRQKHVIPLTAGQFETSSNTVEEENFEVIWRFTGGTLALRGQMGGKESQIAMPSAGAPFFVLGGEEGDLASWWLTAATSP